MPTVERTITVDQPMDKVWGFTSDPDRRNCGAVVDR